MPERLEPITLKLEGRVADRHRIDAFQLADTIQGFGQVIGHSLFFLHRLKVAGKRERVTELQVLAKPPTAGSVELIYFIEALRHLSPVLFEPFVKHGTELLWRTAISTFLFNSGRNEDAMKQSEMTLDYIKSRDRIYAEQRSDEREKDERIIHRLIDANAKRCQSGCKGAVSSLGSTSSALSFPIYDRDIILSEEDASRIRLAAEESVGPETSFICLMDGIIEHNKTIKIQVEGLTEEDRYLTAEVKDSLFGQLDNPYITALNTKKRLVIKARPVLKDGRVVRLIIFEAEVE